MSNEAPIFPYYGSGQDAATTAAASVISLPKGAKQVMLTLTGAANVYFRITDASDTSVATAADCILTGSGTSAGRLLVSKNQDHTRMSLISPGGASTINVMACDGTTTV